ncbi:IL-6 subfamily cytokine M17 [Antennarius striatus]|uniref:IL-6 subfamily cytokine M17 n=1 Tax=Antennarius striatus TaxID=241820 RepID=UPI0035B408E3
MTRLCNLPAGWRMNGHVKSMHFQQFMEAAATFLFLLLLMAVDSSRPAPVRENLQCGNFLQQMLRQTRVINKESADLIKLYKASQGEMPEFFCKVAINDIPDPKISGLQPAEKIASISTHLQAFFPHLKWVYEQQTDLQLPTSPLLKALTTVRVRSQWLVPIINNFYQSLFPNLSLPEPAGGATTLPPPQNVFQQKIYGCVVLKTYKEFLSNVSRELRNLKNVCKGTTAISMHFF